MHLEHLNLVVSDLEKSLKFYKAAFPHWHVRGGGEGEWYGKPRKWIHFGDDYNYLAFSDHGEGTNRDLTGAQVGVAHFAFITNDLQALKARLAESGFQPSKDGADSPYRNNIYYIDPDGFEVEFVEYLSDIPEQRNHYD
ncbi:VOC family protein [Sansalvadorimonas sp. 2012CJ34-2]|uniref:VOC family protein n=2 Tax=Parendozoicomonas callyspongiae TaxID=2942213 RepID=A0ABT0PKT0_9GAMM|nr:VOC family protein [Sansalvadorimonas sp. 2012CJ34-2]MCL6271943.1 VOC family protein [Sansalvadorimonas sp. 2012CJ34-2]